MLYTTHELISLCRKRRQTQKRKDKKSLLRSVNKRSETLLQYTTKRYVVGSQVGCLVMTDTVRVKKIDEHYLGKITQKEYVAIMFYLVCGGFLIISHCSILLLALASLS